MARRRKRLTTEKRLSSMIELAQQRARASEARERIIPIAQTIAARWCDIITDLDHEDLRPVGRWIVDEAVNGEAFEIITVDSGYDVSTESRPTGRHHRIADFHTVESFLGTPNGRTVPTYLSGSGLAADTLFTDYDEFVSGFLTEWVGRQPETQCLDADGMYDLRNLIDAECDGAGLDHRMGLMDFLPLTMDEAMHTWPVEADTEVNLLPGEDPELPVGLATFLDRFPKDLKDHHLTFVTEDGMATFASDNACHLQEWWHDEAIRLVCIPGRQTVLNRRIFTAMKDVESGLPIKRLSSCALHSEGVVSMSAVETRHAFTTDHATGRPLRSMSTTIYEAF